MKQAIISHLKAVNKFGKVGSTLSLASIGSAFKNEKACWVFEVSTSPSEPLPDTGNLLQRETVIFGVVLAVKALNSRTGIKSEDALDALKADVRAELFEFLPSSLEGKYDRLELAGGELLSVGDGKVSWIERFKTARLISRNNLL